MESFTIERERQLKKSTKKVMEAEEFMRSTLDAASNVPIYAITLQREYCWFPDRVRKRQTIQFEAWCTSVNKWNPSPIA